MGLHRREKAGQRKLGVIVGTGRCGSTVLQQITAAHPEVSYPSALLAYCPEEPWMNRYYMRLAHSRGGRVLRSHIQAGEVYRYWSRAFAALAEPCRDLEPRDASPLAVERIRKSVEAIRHPRHPCVLVKFTGWPRILFLKEVFPEARVVWIERDPMAVASSLYHVRFWSGWQGPTNWRWGRLPSGAARYWEDSGYSFAVLAALQVRILMRAFEDMWAAVEAGSVLRISYEGLCAEPRAETSRVLGHMGLGWHTEVSREISKRRLSAGAKWQDNLSVTQVEEMRGVFRIPDVELLGDDGD